MLAERETISPDPGQRFKLVHGHGDGFQFYWHQHDEYELTMIVRGHGMRYVGDHAEPFDDTDLILLPPNLPHSWWTPGPNRTGRAKAWVVQFRANALAPLVTSQPELQPIGTLLSRARGGLRFTPALHQRLAREMATLHTDPPAAQLGRLLSILGHLAEQPGATLCHQAADRFGNHQLPANLERVDRIQRYLIDHLSEPITQAEVAAHCNMSASGLARFIKRQTGRSLVGHLHELRIAAACEQLRHGERRVLDIALDVGFGNLANFNRVFRRLRDCTPTAYRTRFRARQST